MLTSRANLDIPMGEKFPLSPAPNTGHAWVRFSIVAGACSLLLGASCCPPGKQRISTPSGDKVCVEDWIVSLGACVEHSQGYASLTIEQRRRVDAVLGLLGSSSQASVDFGRKFEATFSQRPSESIREIVSACVENVSSRSRQVNDDKTTGLLAAGGVSTALSVTGAAILVAGAIIVEKAESDFHAGPSASARAEASQLGERGEALAVAGLVSSAAFAAVGVPLLVVGKRQQRRVLGTSRISFTGAGVLFSGRF